MTWPEMLFWLLVGHALIDFPLQGDFLAKAKNHRAGIPGVPWQPCLVAHGLIAGGAVAAVTGLWTLGVLEYGLHCVIDWCKNEGLLGFTADQLLHVACKALYVVAICWGTA